MQKELIILWIPQVRNLSITFCVPLTVVEGFIALKEMLWLGMCMTGTPQVCSASADLLCCLTEKPRYYLQSIDKYPFLVSFLFLFVILETGKSMLNFNYLRGSLKWHNCTSFIKRCSLMLYKDLALSSYHYCSPLFFLRQWHPE